jgi:plastocyanin
MVARMSAALVAGALLAVPAAAGAATKTVEVGPFGNKAQKQFQAAFGDANQYFRKKVTIHKGDKVSWEMNGFHTVTFVPEDDPPPALILPDPTSPVSGVLDAAGAPFWFNGQPSIVLNPDAATPQGGKTFNPSKLLNSGLPLAQGPPPPYKLKFKRTGTYEYLCIVHPGMAGKVHVVGKNSDVPSTKKDKNAAKSERQDALELVQGLSTGPGALTNTIQAGNDRRSGATVFRFFPPSPSFRVGQTVTLRMPPQSTEAHTFTFGPTNGKDAYNDQLAANLLGPTLDPRGVYPSEPPPGVPLTPTMHGNGFFNSGILDQNPASALPSSIPVRFGAPGNYSLICLIHPFMNARVIVIP